MLGIVTLWQSELDKISQQCHRGVTECNTLKDTTNDGTNDLVPCWLRLGGSHMMRHVRMTLEVCQTCMRCQKGSKVIHWCLWDRDVTGTCQSCQRGGITEGRLKCSWGNFPMVSHSHFIFQMIILLSWGSSKA